MKGNNNITPKILMNLSAILSVALAMPKNTFFYDAAYSSLNSAAAASYPLFISL